MGAPWVLVAHLRALVSSTARAPSPLAEPDAAEEQDEKYRDGGFHGECEPVRMVSDQPRESTHRPPTVYSTIKASIAYWERSASRRSLKIATARSCATASPAT